jgi:hypothetical protein
LWATVKPPTSRQRRTTFTVACCNMAGFEQSFQDRACSAVHGKPLPHARLHGQVTQQGCHVDCTGHKDRQKDVPFAHSQGLPSGHLLLLRPRACRHCTVGSLNRITKFAFGPPLAPDFSKCATPAWVTMSVSVKRCSPTSPTERLPDQFPASSIGAHAPATAKNCKCVPQAALRPSHAVRKVHLTYLQYTDLSPLERTRIRRRRLRCGEFDAKPLEARRACRSSPWPPSLIAFFLLRLIWRVQYSAKTNSKTFRFLLLFNLYRYCSNNTHTHRTN